MPPNLQLKKPIPGKSMVSPLKGPTQRLSSTPAYEPSLSSVTPQEVNEQS